MLLVVTTRMRRARPQTLQRPAGGLQLKGHGVHHAMLAHHQRLALHGRLAQPCLDGQPPLDEAGRDIEHQFGSGRVDEGNLVQHAQKQRLTVADSFGYPHTGQLPATMFAGIGTLDEPFFVADEDTGTRSWRLGELAGHGRGKSPDGREIMGLGQGWGQRRLQQVSQGGTQDIQAFRRDLSTLRRHPTKERGLPSRVDIRHTRWQDR